MTGESDTSAHELPDWATAQLTGTVADPSKTPRLAILERLDEFNLLPAHDLYAAIYASRDDQVQPEMVQEAEERFLRQRLDQFTENFFFLNSAERHDRWRELLHAVKSYPLLRRRTVQLKPGLKVEADSANGLSERGKQLAALAIEWFQLWPAEQATARRSWSAEIPAEKMSEWREAAGELRKKRPQIAALQQQWLGSLHQPPKRTNSILSTFKSEPKSRVREKSSSSGSTILFIFIALMMIRILFRASDNSTAKSLRNFHVSNDAEQFEEWSQTQLEVMQELDRINQQQQVRVNQNLDQLGVGGGGLFDALPGKLRITHDEQGYSLVFSNGDLLRTAQVVIGLNDLEDSYSWKGEYTESEVNTILAYHDAILTRQSVVPLKDASLEAVPFTIQGSPIHERFRPSLLVPADSSTSETPIDE